MLKWPFGSSDKQAPTIDDPHWERALIQKMALEFLREQRRRARWGLFFKLAGLTYVVVILVMVYSDGLSEVSGTESAHTALVEVKGLISADTEASADHVITALRKAFEAKHAKGIIIRINSPGGSPVQAGYINDEIHRLKAEHPDKPVYAVAVDACASGGYYIAVAADEIYVDKASLIGSIGVRMGSFGFHELIEEWGIERRLLTAGEHKALLDPFQPLEHQDQAFAQQLLDTLHQQFITAVKTGRGERLQEHRDLFSGLIWTGEESIRLGLADGLGSSSQVAREIIGAETIVRYSRKQDLFDRLVDRLGVAVASQLAQMMSVERLRF